MEAPQNKSDVTIQFLVGSSVIHSAGIFHLSMFRSKVLEVCHACTIVEFFFNFWGNVTPKIFFANLDTLNRYFL
jgi:hypothetical protein